MIKIISGVAFIVLFHFVIFILYPDTGKYGNYYLYGLIGIWIFLYLHIITSRFYSLLTFSTIIRLLFFIIMIFISLIIIPQEDKKTILNKIINLKLPDHEQIERGKIKYLNNLINSKSNKIINPIKDEIYNKTKILLKEMEKE